MRRLSATIRMTIALTLLSSSALLLARASGVGPDEQGAVLRGRQEFSEALAIHSSVLLSSNELTALEQSLGAVIQQYPQLLSIDLRKADGHLLFHVVNRSAKRAKPLHSKPSMVAVPLVASNRPWGTLEVSYQPLFPNGFLAFWRDPSWQLLLMVIVSNGLVFFFYLKRSLQHLDPLRVVPERVRNALDTMPGGLVILDTKERIILANKAFAAAMNKLPAELPGLSLGHFTWQDTAGKSLGSASPWRKAVQEGAESAGVTVTLVKDPQHILHYVVNSSPILADDGSRRGALISFDDVTELHRKHLELEKALDVLKASRDEVRQQNSELRRLATRDPLTDCMNRRSFFKALESHWESSQRYNHPLGCVMVDVDHFKSINDRHGHATGDVVLQKVAATLSETIRTCDLVCRYGGEEFCILLPHTTIDQATLAAERYRKAIEELVVSGISITASFGVSSFEFSPSDAQGMMEQADKCLYAAKRQGRNQVIRWDQIPDNIDITSVETRQSDEEEMLPERNSEIPYHAVAALISALAYRDGSTAEHSRRVADLCVVTGWGIMTARECYILEVAGLLHDIGKVGIPDSILLKPGPLTEEEWEIMGIHDRVGVEIIESAFACPALTAIIENHHAWYGGHPRESRLPTGESIPLGARILAIADAYDAMVSNRVYRKGRSQQEAFDELRRCCDRQFDRNLVERFIAAVQARYENRTVSDSHLPREAGVLFGQHIERLADKLDSRDLHGLAALAGRLQRMAHKYQATNLATAAEQLQEAATADSDLQVVIARTTEIMQLCREAGATQQQGKGTSGT